MEDTKLTNLLMESLSASLTSSCLLLMNSGKSFEEALSDVMSLKQKVYDLLVAHHKKETEDLISRQIQAIMELNRR